MPTISPWPDVVHVLPSAGMDRRVRRGTGPIVQRHVGEVGSTVVVHGVRVTSPARTIVDLARTGCLEDAVAAGDFALSRGLMAHADLAAEIAVVPPGTRGLPGARLAVDPMDGASGSPGESLSRVRMFRLNLPRPLLQSEFRDDRGRIGFSDFAWPGVVGEFDGKKKYGTEFAEDGGEVQEILWREKQREDRLRRQVRVARWTWAVALDPARLAATLGHVGIRPQLRNTWFT